MPRNLFRAAALGLGVLLAGSGCGDARSGGESGAAVVTASTDQTAVVGLCHSLTTPEEFASPSDGSPTVPCTEPHTSQTFLTAQVPAALATYPERPFPEQLQDATGNLCPASELRKYLGGVDRDATAGMTITAYYPSRAGWAAGERTVRCDVLLTAPDGSPRENTMDLEGALAAPGSATIRLCYAQDIKDGVLATEGTDTTCSEPHTTEDVSAWFGQDASLVGREAQVQRCLPFVLEFLKVDTLPENVEVRPIVRIDGGARAVRCGVAPRQEVPAPWTGTLAPVGGVTNG